MAKLYFNYATMNAGKSIDLIRAAHNYEEQDKFHLRYASGFDKRSGQGVIASRAGIEKSARVFTSDTNLYEDVGSMLDLQKPCKAVFVDEAQWLTEEQVFQLAKVVDLLRIPVLCYGLLVNFQGKLFPGSKRLVELAQEKREIITMCGRCDSKATMVIRKDASGNALTHGPEILAGGNDTYEAVCRKHFFITTGVYPGDA